MAFKRLLIEIGQGVDMHGADTNNAVRKAATDAMHHCCIAGLGEIFDIHEHPTRVKLKGDIYVPRPEEVDQEAIREQMSFLYDDVEIAVHQGGADPEGIALGDLPKTPITVALVVITVWVDVEE